MNLFCTFQLIGRPPSPLERIEPHFLYRLGGVSLGSITNVIGVVSQESIPFVEGFKTFPVQHF